MKITILNGSPRHNGNTQIMADTFSETARENGHTVNILNIANMNIRGCLGCKYCYSHGGKCVQDDDMENVLAELSDTDMVVFASPVCTPAEAQDSILTKLHFFLTQALIMFLTRPLHSTRE